MGRDRDKGFGLDDAIKTGLDFYSRTKQADAIEQANNERKAELKKRELLEKAFMEGEYARMNADRGLQDDTLGIFNKMRGDQEAEIKPHRDTFYQDLEPYLQEQKQYLKDPASYYKKQDELMRQSPFAGRAGQQAATAGQGIDNNFGTSGVARGTVSESIKNQAAEGFWRDAMSGFNDSHRQKQQQAIQGIGGEYQNRVGDITGKYKGKGQHIQSLMDVALGHSKRMSDTAAMGLGFDTRTSRERAGINADAALDRGQATGADMQFWQNLLGKVTGNSYGNDRYSGGGFEAYVNDLDLPESAKKKLLNSRDQSGGRLIRDEHYGRNWK